MNKPILTWPTQSPTTPAAPADPRFAAGTAWIDDKIVPVGEATLPLLDWGFLRSDACQETISAWNLKPPLISGAEKNRGGCVALA